MTTEIVDKSAAFTGRCLCGKVAFAAEGPPAFAGFCYCTRCRRMSGSGRTPFLGFEDGMISVSGEMESFHDEGEAGSIERLFCGTCGTRMLARPGSAPGITILYAGGLDDPTLFKPEIAFMSLNAHNGRRYPQAWRRLKATPHPDSGLRHPC